MASLLNMLKTQSGRLSLARMACLGAFLLWLGTWLYTLLLNKSYAHFDTVTGAVLILFFVVLVGKSVDSKIISIKGDDKK